MADVMFSNFKVAYPTDQFPIQVRTDEVKIIRPEEEEIHSHFTIGLNKDKPITDLVQQVAELVHGSASIHFSR